VIYQHPLGYLLGLEGLALLRAFNGEHGRDFTLARFAEIRALLDDLDQAGEPAESRLLTAAEGYDIWSTRYDSEDNDQRVPDRRAPGRAAGPALRGDAFPPARPGRGAAAAPDPARSPLGYLDAPPLVPGRLPGGVQRQPADDLLEVPAGRKLTAHTDRRTTAWAAMTRPPSKVSAGEPYSSYPWSSASLTRSQNSASSGPVSSR